MSSINIVTGGGGFIGHHLCKLLDNVIAIDNLTFVNNQLQKRRNLSDIVVTESDNLQFLNSISDISTIYHLASHPNQKAVSDFPFTAFDNIVTSTIRLSNYCKQRNIRLVYISSSMVYGNFLTDPVNELHPLEPVNNYGLYKKIAENYVVENNKNFVVIRPTAVYGPADSINRIISKWSLLALANEPIIVDNENYRLDFTYVDDLVNFIVMAGKSDVNGVFNCSYGQSIRLVDAASMIVQHTGSSSEIIIKDNKDSKIPFRGALDISKAINIGYKPEFDLSKGILRTIQDVSSIC